MPDFVLRVLLGFFHLIFSFFKIALRTQCEIYPFNQFLSVQYIYTFFNFNGIFLAFCTSPVFSFCSGRDQGDDGSVNQTELPLSSAQRPHTGEPRGHLMADPESSHRPAPHLLGVRHVKEATPQPPRPVCPQDGLQCTQRLRLMPCGAEVRLSQVLPGS